MNKLEIQLTIEQLKNNINKLIEIAKYPTNEPSKLLRENLEKLNNYKGTIEEMNESKEEYLRYIELIKKDYPTLSEMMNFPSRFRNRL